MMRRLGRVLGVATVSILGAAALAACGSSDKKSSGTSGGAETKPVSGQQKGGTLKVLSNEGFAHLDPGSSYFQLDYEVVYAAHRPLYSFKPDDSSKAKPDLATGPPKLSNGEKTVTIKIRPGVKYSPGTVDRTVTSKDVKYAIERGFNKNVANGYAPAYFNTIVGADKAIKDADGGPIKGIKTPDDQTIVFNLNKPFGATLAQALSLPLSAPVPEEYVAKFDKSSPSKYDSDPTIQAFTGPYVIKSYKAGRSIVLGRNPNWDGKAQGDYRPAYLDAVTWSIGADPNVSGRQILRGKDLVNGDTPAAPIVKLGVTKFNDQISFTPLGNRYVALNTTLKPFDDVNVRRAVAAVLDRAAMQRTRGGKAAGDIATHMLAPNAPGFEQAGGMQGTAEWMKNPNGDLKLAQDYLKKAGFADGKFSGPEIFMVGSTEDPASKTAQVVLAALQKLGFKVKFRSVPQETMYSRFCNVPKQKVQVCPNVGWLPDFSDGFAWLYPVTSGKAIVPLNNTNQAQLNEPATNKLLDQAAEERDPTKRNDLWGKADAAVTETAGYVPWFWDKVVNVESKNVQGVIATWNAAYDLSFTSLKK
jgi:peptide/nickel transport system substrate-binding protein